MVSIDCRACGAAGAEPFYEVTGVPAHSVLLMRTKQQAVDYPRGDIELAVCPVCGFIGNAAFDSSLHEYSQSYEETQGFSPTFNAFHRRLADRLIDRYGLVGKDIVEVGCGKGEFLALLCKGGRNRGVGFDPAYVAERGPSTEDSSVRFVSDFYSEKYAGAKADFVCCKMTLEHIPAAADFVSMIGRTLAGSSDTVVFFQVPDAGKILRDVAFWDVYYEHCSYFTAGALVRLFRACGFDVVDVGSDYDGQYLTVEGHPRASSGTAAASDGVPVEDARDVVAAARRFGSEARRAREHWQRRLGELAAAGKRVVIWGGGSKAVSFLTTLELDREIDCAVDINPYRAGSFLPGSGHEIVAPAALKERRPDVVLAMNPIYRDEIAADLSAMGVAAELITV